MKSRIIFGDRKLKKAFHGLKNSKTENAKLHRWLKRALEDLEENAFSGTQIPKRLIPREYIKKYGKIDNLWKYNLPNAWRLIYTVQNSEVVVISIMLEWMTHKDYENRFKY